jgi:hypothetical protein
MGVRVYACGKIDRIEDIPRLILELKAIAGESNRTYQIINDDVHTQPDAESIRRDLVDPGSVLEGASGLKGIIIDLDPEAEPFSILFDRSGVLTDRTRHMSWIRGNRHSERYTAFKTQFPGIDPRLRISGLLAVLKEKYITDLIVNDEETFWKTRDRRIMKDERIILGHCLCYAELVIGGTLLSDDAVRNPETITAQIEEALLKDPFTDSKPTGNRNH